MDANLEPFPHETSELTAQRRLGEVLPERLLSQQVLRTDIAGMPLEWIDYKEAVRLHHTPALSAKR
jgi:hypothetical protein